MIIENITHRPTFHTAQIQSVPESSSEQFRSGLRKDIYCRAANEYEYTRSCNGVCLFPTFTFNNNRAHHISDYYPEFTSFYSDFANVQKAIDSVLLKRVEKIRHLEFRNSAIRFYNDVIRHSDNGLFDPRCFDYSDFREVTHGHFYKTLRKKYHAKLTYFAASEYGGTHHVENYSQRAKSDNPHIHALLYITPLRLKRPDGTIYLDPLFRKPTQPELENLLRETWQWTNVNGTEKFIHHRDVQNYKHGIVSWSKSHGLICTSADSAKYCSKYVGKDTLDFDFIRDAFVEYYIRQSVKSSELMFSYSSLLNYFVYLCHEEAKEKSGLPLPTPSYCTSGIPKMDEYTRLFFEDKKLRQWFLSSVGLSSFHEWKHSFDSRICKRISWLDFSDFQYLMYKSHNHNKLYQNVPSHIVKCDTIGQLIPMRPDSDVLVGYDSTTLKPLYLSDLDPDSPFKIHRSPMPDDEKEYKMSYSSYRSYRDFVETIYVRKIRDIRFNEYRNTNSAKCRVSKSFGASGVGSIRHLCSRRDEPSFYFHHSSQNNLFCTATRYYKQKLFYDSYKDPITGNVRRVRNELGLQQKVADTYRSIFATMRKYDEAFSFVSLAGDSSNTNAETMRKHGYSPTPFIKEMISYRGCDEEVYTDMLYRFSVYCLVYQYRSFCQNDLDSGLVKLPIINLCKSKVKEQIEFVLSDVMLFARETADAQDYYTDFATYKKEYHDRVSSVARHENISSYSMGLLPQSFATLPCFEDVAIHEKEFQSLREFYSNREAENMRTTFVNRRNVRAVINSMQYRNVNYC